MQKNYLLLMLVCLCFRLDIQAQITVTNATFPLVGDNFNYGIDINPAGAGLITPPGFNQTWDFSGLQTDQTSTTVFLNPNTGAHSASFPGADLLVLAMGREYYYNVTGNVVELRGYLVACPMAVTPSRSRAAAVPARYRQWPPLQPGWTLYHRQPLALTQRCPSTASRA